MDKQVTVVGAVIQDAGMILCARRGGTGALAGLWEFPGGKVEPGETPRQALEREIREELQCVVDVGAEVTTTTHKYDFALVTLTTFQCRLIEGSPTLTEHTEVRWVQPSKLLELPWAAADIPAVKMMETA